MAETIRIALFTLLGISAIFSVIKEFQKPEKKSFGLHSKLSFFWSGQPGC
ncbi:hypothetical protein P4T37_27075 [Bacillus mobilis]|nr:hypothetical protein [Bacillus mobilis]